MNLKFKLLIVFLFIAIIPMIFMGVVVFSDQKKNLQDQLIREREKAVLQESEKINFFIDYFVSQIRLAQQYPAVRGISESGSSYEEQENYQQWKEQLQNIFSSIIRVNPLILQARYIDELGNELVRVNAKQGNLEVVSENDLQNKKGRDYFKETIKLGEEDVYVSNINLNIEHRKIETPYKPVVRFSAPVFDEKNINLKGIIVFNVTALHVLDLLGEIKLGHNILIDQDGSFIFHPDKRKKYSKPLNTKFNYFDEQPELADNLRTHDKYSLHDKNDKEIRVWKKVFYQPGYTDRYWVIFSIVTEKELFVPIRKLMHYFAFIFIAVFMLTTVVAFITAGAISRPILKITDAARKVTKGETNISIEGINPDDEIGILAKAFNHMVDVRKRIEEDIKSKNNELETLLYIVSHDLKEPLRSMEYFAHSVNEQYADKLEQKGQDYLRRIVKAGTRMRLLLDDILMISRARRIKNPTTYVDGKYVVKEAMYRLGEKIKETNARITVSDGLPKLRAHKTWAIEAVFNLISNALKYTKDGLSPEIEIDEYVNKNHTNESGIVVRDRGPGVDQEYAQKIFELFQRAAGRDVEGVGAGLAIVREIARKHGGRSWVQPRKDGGSEFFITFSDNI